MKVALLGVWHVHADEYTQMAKNAGATVTGVWDENPAWRDAFAARNGIAAYESLDDLLASDAEGVIVCAATSVHTDCIIRAAKAGKHIFTEKVLALTEAECHAIEAAVKEAGVRFAISFPWKFRPGQMALKAAVDAGRIGKVNYLRFRNCHNGSTGHWLPAHFYNKEECGGGAMIDLGAHGMYLAHWILGEPIAYASAFTHACRDEQDAALNPSELEDNAITVMTFPNGAIAVNETGFVTVGCPTIFEIGGDAGYLTFDGERATLNTPAEGCVELELPAPVASPLERFVLGEDVPGCGMQEAIVLTRMMEGAYR